MRGEVTTGAQKENWWAETIEAHAGIHIYDQSAANWTSGLHKFFGIKYL
jgi:hypothetical protein